MGCRRRVTLSDEQLPQPFAIGLCPPGRPGRVRLPDFHRGEGPGAEPRGRKASVGRGSHRLHGEGRFCPHSGKAGPVSAVACAFLGLEPGSLRCCVTWTLPPAGPSRGKKLFHYVPLFIRLFMVDQLESPRRVPPTHSVSASPTGQPFLSRCQQKAPGAASGRPLRTASDRCYCVQPTLALTPQQTFLLSLS